MSKQFLIFFGVGVVVIVIAVVTILSANKGSHLELKGNILKVRTGALSDNETGVAGVNWQVQMMPLKFLGAKGGGKTTNAVLALNYAVAHGVKLSNNSWGGGEYDSDALTALQRGARRLDITRLYGTLIYRVSF